MSTQDKILHRFLQNSFEEARELEKNSDVFSLADWRGEPPSQFLLLFQEVKYLSKMPEEKAVCLRSLPIFVEVSFPADYLRSIDPDISLKVVRLLNPDFFHPNIKLPFGFICLGHNFLHGSTLCDIIYQVYEIITYQNMTVEEQDALNPEACRYCRSNSKILKKIQPPPLRRKRLKVNIRVENIS